MVRWLLVLVMFLGVGCVAQSKYDELQVRYDRLQDRTERQEERIKTLRGAMDRMRGQFEEIRKELQPLIDRGILEVRMERGRVAIGMAADVLFPSGSAVISTDGRGHLAAVARALGHIDEDFQVEGHTDSDPIATPEFPSNWHLGAERAINVVDFMTTHGMSARRLSAASYAAMRPVESNDSEAHKARNRRIDVVLMPDLTVLPGYDELREPDRDGREEGRKKKKKKDR